jgi:hypothetical protein
MNNTLIFFVFYDQWRRFILNLEHLEWAKYENVHDGNSNIKVIKSAVSMSQLAEDGS